jgi:sugar transferase (PEP-CTERM/EpsH1 system associated)
MREILFLAHRIPYPPDRGDKIRSWNILKHLGTLARVHLACFADDEADAAHLDALRSAMGGSLGEAHVEIRRKNRFAAAAEAIAAGKPISLTMFDSAALRTFVDSALACPAVGSAYAFSGQMAQFVPQPCAQHFIMDFVDMDSAKFAEYAGGGPMRWAHKREAEKLFAFERATAARAGLSLFVSEAEAALFRAKAPEARVAAISNGIDLDFYGPQADSPRIEAPARPLIVFTGQMDYRPNVEAVTSFAKDAMPSIRQRHPSAAFAIVGRNPPPAVLRLAEREGVIVTGAVPDVRSWLAAADVVVAPLRIARGIQNKVLEAMAMARPVIASPAAFEGIDAEPGRDLIVASDEGAAVADLLADPAAAAAIGAAARRQMEKSYRWSARLAPLAAMLAPEREAA